MQLEKALSLDKKLFFKKRLDGEKTISRRSPFNAQREFEVADLTGLFVGSARWVRDVLINMDTQRQNIIGRVRENNLAIRNGKKDFRAHKEIAELFHTGGDTFIN